MSNQKSKIKNAFAKPEIFTGHISGLISAGLLSHEKSPKSKIKNQKSKMLLILTLHSSPVISLQYKTPDW